MNGDRVNNQNSKKMIELKGVTKQYLYGARVLGNTDMRVDSGEIVALLGDSGSGKTTLLKVIAGVTDCEGDVLIDGSHIAKKPDDVIMLFDDLAVFKNRSFYYNLSYPLTVRGVEKHRRDKLVKEAAERMGITACLYEKVYKMPLIDVKRLAVARLFLRDYKVLLVDDITDGLSREEADELWGELAPILIDKAKQGVSVVFATKNRDEALSVADRIAVMHYGEIKQVDSVENIKNNPSNIWAAQALDGHYHFERVRLERKDDVLKIVLGVKTPTERSERKEQKEDTKGYELDASVFDGKIVDGYEGKDVFIGWHSDGFAIADRVIEPSGLSESDSRSEKVKYSLRTQDGYELYTESGICVKSKEKTDTVCTLPNLACARLYDFASENSLHK